MSQETLEKIVTELDVLIRARYPLIAINTPEVGRFHRIMLGGTTQVSSRERERAFHLEPNDGTAAGARF